MTNRARCCGWAALSLIAIAAAPAWAAPRLPAVFGDHMILQQGREIPVWGWAGAGERITVSLSSYSRETVAAADGRWKLNLPAMNAGGPYVLTISGTTAIVFKDVLIGEVWICSGQSNMAFALQGAATAAQDVPDATYEGIRLLQVPRRSFLAPADDAPGAAWQRCSPQVARRFSAVGYLFARELHKKLGVPVGIIQSAWSGTQAEVWTEQSALQADPDFAAILQRWEQAPASNRALAREPAAFALEFDRFELLRRTGEPAPLTPFWEYDWDSAPRTTFELTPAVRIAGQLTFADSSMLTGRYRPRGEAVDLGAYDGFRFYYRGKGAFKVRSTQPTITDVDDYATPVFRASAGWQPATVLFRDLRQAGWGVKRPITPEALTGFQLEAVASADGASLPPASLYNAMIAPLAPFAIRGAIWYQGEGNAGRAWQYRKLLPAMIRGWRKAWGADFAFLIAQLPSFGAQPEQPAENEWAELREAQLLALREPNTGLAVTLDVGEAGNVHPNRKTEVAQRLALWALGATYGKDLVYSGPLFESASVEGDRIRVRFRHTGTGLRARGEQEVKGLAIAGQDRKFHWAAARVEGGTVLVWSPEVPSPVAVRYAWSGTPVCNLENSEGLPASPFRSDDWPGITVGRK